MLPFRANKSVADVTREDFYAATLLSFVRPSFRNPAPLLVLVSALRGSRSTTSKTIPMNLIVVNESREESLEKGANSLVQNA